MNRTLSEMQKQTNYLAESTRAATQSIELSRESLEKSDQSTQVSVAALVAQVDALRDSAEAARFSAEISRRQLADVQRARVHFENIQPTRKFTTDWKTLSAVIFRTRWVNKGGTSTRHAQSATNFEIRSSELPSDFTFPDYENNFTPVVVAPGSVVMSSGLTVDVSAIRQIQSGEKKLYLWGWIRYYDIFNPNEVHVTKYCQQLVAMNPSADEATTTIPNVEQFVFHGCPAHVCVDEECGDLSRYADPGRAQHISNVDRPPR